MDLYLIDAISPFFIGNARRKTNWSKIPFDHIRPDKPEADELWASIEAGMEVFAEKVADVGYNAVSLDDVAHLAQSDHYEIEIQDQIHLYQKRYRPIIDILQKRGLKIYVTMDVLSYTSALLKNVGTSTRSVTAFIKELLTDFFKTFPEVKGVIMRIGESDGLDVHNEFRSQLILKRAKQVNRLLKETLPVFEEQDRELIFRTWTVGAYGIGDLMWHRSRFIKIFQDIDSPAITISMKYGESDFFRYLPLNSHFFRLNLPTIVELQARREYEGSGEFPSFIGEDYSQYAQELRKAPRLRGISVWCQTGGWTPFCRLTYIEKEGIWNEINAAVALQVFRDQVSPEAALRNFAQSHNIPNIDDFVNLMQKSEMVVKRLLYIPDIAKQKFFFRRVRIPPLLSVYWNNIFINHSLKKILMHLTKNPKACVRDGYAALEEIELMHAHAEKCKLPVDDIEFMYDTFSILAIAREYYYQTFDRSIRNRLKAAKKSYKNKYPKSLRPRYRIKMNFDPFPIKRRTLGWVSYVALRRQRGYRIIDRLLILHFLSTVYWVIRKRKPNIIPKFARKSAMGIDTVFR
ncbi:hypothetical protein [Rubellicoccus peritrichatus]|uniref:Glycosyl hydrolase family 67 n=1 Tax=Rubellicoccus peritrichatus TaxID=3080537 RepID=A0AAQ3L6R3_9BACT|nr:hypothetical protein [Puniceicoccus sp. CR14]WOO40355.1 hypothetical protein RZN69_17185 [Puniceicoccus sp. CR14]